MRLAMLGGMRRSPWRRAAATLAATLSIVLLLGACAADPGPPAPGVVRVALPEPTEALIPANADEPLVARILPALTAGLVAIAPDGEVVLDLAESIETEDNTVYTVTVVAGATFSDGQPVTASSFVDAWQAAALPGSGHPDRGAFEPIRGWAEETDPPTEDEDGDAGDEGTDGEEEADPTVGDLVAGGGLEVLDDESFRISLRDPRPEFPSGLARAAFLPLPEVAFADPDGYAAGAVGAGPYRFAGADAWHPGDRLELEANPGYAGSRTPVNGGISFRFFADTEVAVAELLAGEVDVVDRLAPGQGAALPTRGGVRLIDRALPASYVLVAPDEHPQLGGRAGLLRRTALAAAIDRSRIVELRLDADATPARDFLPVDFLPESRQLPEEERVAVPWLVGANDFFAQGQWNEAEELGAWESSLAIAVVRNTPEARIAEGISERWATALGISAVVLRFPDEAALAAELSEDGVPAFVLRRVDFDAPAVLLALEELVPAEDRPGTMTEQLDAAVQAIEPREAVRLGLLAQEPLASALPVIPVATPTVTALVGGQVSEVVLGWTGTVEYTQIRSAP